MSEVPLQVIEERSEELITTLKQIPDMLTEKKALK